MSVQAGGSPYNVLPKPGPHVGDGMPYIYPPPFAALLASLSPSYQTLYRATLILGPLGFLALAWVASRLAGFGLFTAFGLWGALSFYRPALALVWMGNVHPAIQGITALGLLAPLPVSAALFAFCGAVKVTPAWPLLALLTRSRKTWAPALGVAFGLAVLCWYWMGPGFLDACLVWFRDVAPTLAQGQFEVDPQAFHTWNLSPSFAPLYVMAPWPHGMELPAWARLWLTAVQLGVPAVVLYRTRRYPWNVQAGWVFVAATLAAPIVRPAYLIVLLLVPGLANARKEADSERTPGSADHGRPAMARE